jgi:hypothetical protein
MVGDATRVLFQHGHPRCRSRAILVGILMV